VRAALSINIDLFELARRWGFVPLVAVRHEVVEVAVAAQHPLGVRGGGELLPLVTRRVEQVDEPAIVDVPAAGQEVEVGDGHQTATGSSARSR
jgi:hypothetical protein